VTKRDATVETLDAVRGLQLGLSGLAAALEGGRLTDILDSEPVLSRALGALAALQPRLRPANFDADGAATIRHELQRVAALVGRCAALGRTLDDVVRNRCGVTGYGASGETIATPVRPSLDQRV
jgi:hypothetical protein